jgi:hypothetical protein
LRHRHVPADEPTPDVFNVLDGRIEILGDIVSPVTRPEDWELEMLFSRGRLRAESLPLVTSDERIRASPLVKTIW